MAHVPFKVKAIYDYTSQEADDLSFPVGQVIAVTEEVDADWYEGEYTDSTGTKKSGIFPTNFVEKYEPEIPTRPSRPARPKQESQPVAPSSPAITQERDEPEVNDAAAPAPTVPSASKPPTIAAVESSRSIQPPEPQPTPITRSEPPTSSKPTSPESISTEARKPPPPVAPKSNAFKDRIAAFNQPAAAPILPFQSGQKSQPPGSFIKKPFVAPPPSKDSYVPPPKQDPVHKPYLRGEDPEIQLRQEEDRAAADAAGFSAEPAEDGEDAPKPQSLKDRIAMLQKQQLEQAQRRADTGQPKKEKKQPPIKKPSESSDRGVNADDEAEELHRSVTAESTARRSVDLPKDRSRISSAQQRPQESLPPVPIAPEQEISSGGEEADQSAADETTEDDAGTIGPDDSDERPIPATRAPIKAEPDAGEEEETIEDGEDGEEDEVDEEARRKLELRERMAKMSGGMGMAGMFGPPGGVPMPGVGAPKKRGSGKEKRPTDDSAPPSSPPTQQQRVPMVPIPGMPRVQSPENDLTQSGVGREDEYEDGGVITGERRADEVPDLEDVKPGPPPRSSLTQERGAPPPVPKERPGAQATERAPPPPVPGDRPAPRVPSSESRPLPPPPPAATIPQTPGSESDDEASMLPGTSATATPDVETPLPPQRGAAPPVPRSAQAPHGSRTSYFGGESSITSGANADRRSSKLPPVPIGSPLASPRPPPPPPPPSAAPPTRSGIDVPPAPTNDERGESEYEGDYDTDIASSAKHKDALKAHVREPSLDDSTTADETPLSSPAVAQAPQLPPPSGGQRAVPPIPPQTVPSRPRQSVDVPRAPPPVPPTRDAPPRQDGDDYDPYRYTESARSPPPPVPTAVPVAAPPVPPREQEADGEESSDDMYSAPIPRKSVDRPPPPPPGQGAPQPPPARAAPRQSLDAPVRRSTEQGRLSGEQGQIATDIDLSEGTQWWTAPQALPPVLENKNGIEILSESEESTKSKRGGRTTVSKDIYVLFMDYSQTVITARYDSREPSDVTLEQRHEAPPPKLRQDQLESYWQQYGAKLAETANSLGGSKKEATVGDGSPASLVYELIKAQPDALLPIGTRAFGALVYANLANASVMQFDEIRPGDVVTLRNAKFEGKHSGPMHQKYKQESGPSHVAIVNEWDGTKKKVRAWEQGREKKGGLKSESFRLGDLKSGEVRVWRVVGRDWVGWDSNA